MQKANKIINLIKRFKLLTLLVLLGLVFTAIYYQGVKTMAAFPDKPGFTINNVIFDPKEAKVGEDIEVTGTIIPSDFEIPMPSKEIVLVLDVSGSMDGEVEFECKNERITYCTEHESSDPNHSGRRHNWVNNYCVEHNKSENHKSTKIVELKKAANNFVDRMKDVPNLKIGIVAYSSKSWINPSEKDGNESTHSIDTSDKHDIPNYQSVGSELLDIKDGRLSNMINSLEALGGTNTGEGLRKAEYMLRYENNASKTIVLMSDGLPTFYSVKGSNDRRYYTNIDNTNPYYAGNGSNDNSGDCLDYAKTIGGLIKDKGYNVFSIGYGLNNDGNNKLSQIHESMGGNASSNVAENEKTYFATDTGAIDTVFQNIATQIINNYDIKNGIFKSHMINGFQLAGGENTVSIPDIQYKKDEANSDSNKIRYHAEPYEFSFKIKASMAGYYSNLFQDSYIEFPWNEETISYVMPESNIKIVDNKLPNIEATIKEVKTSPCELGDEVEITYDIKPQDFIFNDMSSQLVPKDVVIILDTSSSMKVPIDGNGNGAGGGPLISTLEVDLLKNHILYNKNIKFGIVTADSSSVIKSNLKDGSSLHDIVKNIDASSSTTSNMKLAMENANKVLSGTGSRSDANKYVVIISMGELRNEDEGVKELLDKGYNIISMTFESSDNNNLESYHEKLITNGNFGDIEENYLISGDKHIEIKNSMDAIATKLKDEIYRKYNFNDVKLNFDLNGNFDVVSGLEGSEDKRFAKVPNIEYINNNGVWKANQTTVSFKIKPNKIGTLKFKDNNDINNLSNTISYTGITEDINKAIETPIIKVLSPIQVIHGIYKSIDSGELELDKTGKHFVKESIVPMAASFEFDANTTIELKIDENISIVGDIDICKINNNGTFSILDSISNNNSITYTKSINNGFTVGDKVLILYNAKLPNKVGSYRNYIEVGDLEPVPAIVSTKDEKLPDLY